MIYITVGSQRFPFTRLLLSINSAIEEGLIDDETHVQYGSFRPEFKLDQFYQKKPVYPYEEHIELIRHADMIIAHAGEDIVMLSLMLGKIPIIMPRQKNYGEHIDNHQVEFAAKMNDLQKAIAVYQVDDLIYAICNYYDTISSMNSNINSDLKSSQSTGLINELNVLLQSCIGNAAGVKENWKMV